MAGHLASWEKDKNNLDPISTLPFSQYLSFVFASPPPNVSLLPFPPLSSIFSHTSDLSLEEIGSASSDPYFFPSV